MSSDIPDEIVTDFSKTQHACGLRRSQCVTTRPRLGGRLMGRLPGSGAALCPVHATSWSHVRSKAGIYGVRSSVAGGGLARGCSLATHWAIVSSLTSPRRLSPSHNHPRLPTHPPPYQARTAAVCALGGVNPGKFEWGTRCPASSVTEARDWESWHHRSDSTFPMFS